MPSPSHQCHGEGPFILLFTWGNWGSGNGVTWSVTELLGIMAFLRHAQREHFNTVCGGEGSAPNKLVNCGVPGRPQSQGSSMSFNPLARYLCHHHKTMWASCLHWRRRKGVQETPVMQRQSWTSRMAVLSLQICSSFLRWGGAKLVYYVDKSLSNWTDWHVLWFPVSHLRLSWNPVTGNL